MKKLYASLCVAALGAGAAFAQAPALTAVWTKAYDMEVGEFDPADPNWSNKDAIKATAGMHNGIGVAGKLYGIDMRTMSVTAFDANGATKAYDLPSLEGKKITYVTIDANGKAAECADYYGSFISRDDAGHLLIGHGYNTGATCYNWTVLDRETGATKTLSATPAAENDLRACLPNELVPRGIGDVTKEGYLFVAPTSIYWPYNGTDQLSSTGWGGEYRNVQRVKFLNFTGNGTVEGTDMSLSFSGPAPMANWLLTTPAPWYPSLDALKAAMTADPTMVTMDQSFFFYSKLQGSAGGQWDVNVGILNPAESYKLIPPIETFTNACDLLGVNYTMYQGFDTFELNGARYYVAAFNDDSELKTEGIIQIAVFDEEGYLVYDANDVPAIWTYEGNWSDSGVQCGTRLVPAGSFNLNVEYANENNVNIYVWAQAPGSGVFAGMFNFGDGNIDSGVNDIIAAETDAAPVYYNLNGVRVANPANGIFIEKRGNKVTKVIK